MNIDNAIKIIEHEWNKPLTTYEMADRLNCHFSTFKAQFKEKTGSGFRTYLTNVRMGHAVTMLTADIKIDAIAILTGYKSKKNFYRQFKRYYHTTPLKYKKNVLSINSSL